MQHNCDTLWGPTLPPVLHRPALQWGHTCCYNCLGIVQYWRLYSLTYIRYHLQVINVYILDFFLSVLNIPTHGPYMAPIWALPPKICLLKIQNAYFFIMWSLQDKEREVPSFSFSLQMDVDIHWRSRLVSRVKQAELMQILQHALLALNNAYYVS